MRRIDRRDLGRHLAVALPSLAGATLAIAVLECLGVPNASAVYLAAVVATAFVAGTWGRVVAAVASFLLYDGRYRWQRSIQRPWKRGSGNCPNRDIGSASGKTNRASRPVAVGKSVRDVVLARDRDILRDPQPSIEEGQEDRPVADVGDREEPPHRIVADRLDELVGDTRLAQRPQRRGLGELLGRQPIAEYLERPDVAGDADWLERRAELEDPGPQLRPRRNRRGLLLSRAPTEDDRVDQQPKH
jgi:hypothetical protein